MIDDDGYRLNVGLIVANHTGKLLFAKRADIDAWQFPQGGIDEGENPVDAMYRELYEELGLKPQDVTLLAESNEWLYYKTKGSIKRQDESKHFIGQKQKWFLLRLESKDETVNLTANPPPEFTSWQWVSYWYPLEEVVPFKKEVYSKVLEEFQHHVVR